MPLFLLITGILIAVYGLGVLAIIGLGHWSNLLLVALGIGLIIVSRLWKYLFKVCRPAGVALAVVLALCVLVFCVVEGQIIACGCSRPAPDADWVILLGARVNNSGPSVEFKARISLCAEYLKENPGAVAVVSGGRGWDEPVSEAAAAKMALEGLGITGNRILMEENSTSTEENLRFSQEVIEAAGGSPADDPVVIVSSAFHLYRASIYAKKIGYGSISGAGSQGLRFLIPYYYVREFAGCLVEFLGL